MTDDEIAAAAAELKRIIETSKAGMPPGERGALRAREAALQEKLENEFLRRHGWKISKACAQRSDLRSIFGTPWSHDAFDHPSVYFDPAARTHILVAQPYSPAIDHRAYAAAHGLGVEHPDFPAWHFPGWAVLAVWRNPSPRLRRLST